MPKKTDIKWMRLRTMFVHGSTTLHQLLVETASTAGEQDEDAVSRHQLRGRVQCSSNKHFIITPQHTRLAELHAKIEINKCCKNTRRVNVRLS